MILWEKSMDVCRTGKWKFKAVWAREGRDGVWSSPINKFNSNTWLDYYIWMYSCVCHGIFSCQWWRETTELMMAEAWRCACSSPKSSLSNLSTPSAGKILSCMIFFSYPKPSHGISTHLFQLFELVVCLDLEKNIGKSPVHSEVKHASTIYQ